VTRVALVANRDTPEMHEDGPLLLAAFGEAGIEAVVVPWGAGPEWSSFDAVLIRHCWDYIFDRGVFLDWADEVERATRLANAADVLRWNTDKRYLRDLERKGIATVPTVWVEPGEAMPQIDWLDLVVKPSVSAGARLSARYKSDEDLTDHIRRIHTTGAAAMVQPYIASVDGDGETGTYVFGGRVSHAIRKGPILEAGQPASDDLSAASRQRVGPAAVEPELASFARAVLENAPPVLYARVDTAPGPDGHPVLLELEVTEPYFFLEHEPAAARRFVAAVVDWL